MDIDTVRRRDTHQAARLLSDTIGGAESGASLVLRQDYPRHWEEVRKEEERVGGAARTRFDAEPERHNGDFTPKRAGNIYVAQGRKLNTAKLV